MWHLLILLVVVVGFVLLLSSAGLELCVEGWEVKVRKQSGRETFSSI